MQPIRFYSVEQFADYFEMTRDYDELKLFVIPSIKYYTKTQPDICRLYID